ncbi:MAG: hypothetical protein ACYDHM_16370 [Acidiferrobacterales bacterium]
MALSRSDHPAVDISLNIVSREILLRQLTDGAAGLSLMGQPPGDYDVEA